MKWIIASLVALLPFGAAAHPHVFVETGFELVFAPDGRVEAIRVKWRYDELTSLYVTEEYGVDADFDGVATAEELAKIKGFDLEWPEDFKGDTYVTFGGSAVALGPPQAVSAGFAEGMVETVHERRFAEPVDPGAGALVISPYDPTYFSAYEVAWETGLAGRPACESELWVPDGDAAAEQLQAALDELQAGAMAAGEEEAMFPPVGDLFAQEVRVTCAAG
ncbi:DUF1007 family protein [Vannielia sp.]|uniref:DUF1007 family protein n=1 Tax=Vannielia sp. TaxID=2813045 RepID=UPI0026344359|nr:DUF1007 family protein [Vannielia sp.]MDF1871466.1 DUF1007 family protein [Vannielia sp.]